MNNWPYFIFIPLMIFALGFFAGTICYENYGTKITDANELKLQCEAELTRNKSCIMKFVPEIKEMEEWA